MNVVSLSLKNILFYCTPSGDDVHDDKMMRLRVNDVGIVTTTAIILQYKNVSKEHVVYLKFIHFMSNMFNKNFWYKKGYIQLLAYWLMGSPTPAGQAAEISACYKLTIASSKIPSGNWWGLFLEKLTLLHIGSLLLTSFDC